VEALLATEGTLPVNLKFLFEGQEEIGSPDLLDFVTAQRERLACDLVVSADGMQWDVSHPAIWVGLKGLCSLEIDVNGANQDLHSGIHGGMVQNPIHVLAGLIASLRNPEGRITIEGFYDSVVDLTEEDRKRMALVPFSAEDEAERLGVNSLVSEPGYTPQEHAWARPTVEVNGIWGGYQGGGTKTVLPNSAHAKITCRLVPDQNPDDTVDAIRQHLESRVPAGVTVSVKPGREGANPYRITSDHPGNEIAHAVLEEVYGKEPYYVWTGGTIPFCALMLQQLGVHTVNFGFQLEDEQLHAPNEFIRLYNFQRGQGAYIRLLQTIGEKGLSPK
jgi:acetylornithine deacetylase/succinyl-diaminopimelate desuccinylase-like protein